MSTDNTAMTRDEVQRLREELLRRRMAGTGVGAPPTVPRADRGKPLPLHPGQQQQWFLSQLNPDHPEYLIPLTLRLRGELDATALRTAFERLVRRHEILHTRYELRGGEPVQVPDSATVPYWRTEDTAGETAALEYAERFSLTPIDLGAELPIRAALLRLAADDHLFCVVFHHIAADARSLEIFGAELGALYRAAVTGRDAQLPELPVQYADFAAWQRDQLTGANLERLTGYWRERLAGLEPTELPADHQRPPIRDWHGAAVPFTVRRDLAERIRTFGRACDATPFMVLLAAFQTVLARHTGRDDVAVGTVVSERNRPELQHLIGYGINSVVVRTRVAEDPTFAELLGDVRSTVLDAFDHAEVPFARLVDELQPERDTSRTPLFQISFTVVDAADSAFDLPGVEVRRVQLPWRVAKFDLAVQIEQGPDGLHGQIEYATALFDRATVERLAGHLVNALESAVADPSRRISDVGLLAAAERRLVAPVAVDVPGLELPAGTTIAAAFERQVRRTPDATAVVFQDVTLTYAQVNEQANRLAHHLREYGAGPGSLVAVCLPRGADLVPALLGVLKSGAGYLPLDPAHPVGRLAAVLAEAGPAALVTIDGLTTGLREAYESPVVLLDDPADRAAVDARPATDPEPLAGPEDLAYVIYTSGSTGRPKGVQVTHRNVLRLMAAGTGLYDFTGADVWPLFHSYAFDVSVWELWGSLLFGGRLVVVPADVVRAPGEFLDLLVAHGVTVLNQTPSAFRGLVKAAADGDPRIDSLALRLVVFAGERLDIPQLAPWVARRGLDAPVLANMYGITETTVHSTFHRVVAADLDPAAGNPIGVPLADLRIYLLDRYGEPAPVGAMAEIHVGGPGVTAGYLGRPELTAERFLPDPWGPPGARLYRSGDLARRMPDGRLQYLGRRDDQVKIRGYRIELAEIVDGLRALPELADAVVTVREDTPGDRRLIGYVVPAPGRAADPRRLRQELGRTLPEYMIPAAFVPIDAIPLTANGKLDYRALPDPRGNLLRAGHDQAPGSVTEKRLAATWASVLDVEDVRAHDNFFELGGDSIRAVAVVGALREEGFDVTVRDVFQHRTVAALGAVLDERDPLTTQLALVERFALISPADRDLLPEDATDAYPLSQLQSGMVVEMLADRERNTYHNVTTFRIRDDRPFSASRLRDAVDEVVARHEILRTSIELTGYSQPLQVVHEAATMPLRIIDMRGMDADAQQRALHEFTAEERATLFDLSSPPLLRAAAHISDGSWWISMTECHAILEGWSYHSILMEVLDAYRAGDPGGPRTQSPALRYADFIAAEQASIDSAEDRAYWQQTVQRYPKLTLPTGWGVTDGSGGGVVHRSWVEYGDLTEKLREIAVRTQGSLKSVIFSAHVKVMSMLTDLPRFRIGLVCNGRPEVLGADKVHGLYLNTLPFGHERTAGTWRELIQQTFSREAELWPHRRFPMPTIQRDLADDDRLLDVRFTFLDFHMIDTELVDLDASIDAGVSEFGLVVHATPGRTMIAADVDVISRADVERLVAMHRRVLEAMIADLDGDARDTLGLLPGDERQQLLTDWNASAVTWPGEPGVAELFEARARAVPEAIAVRTARGALTYRELDERANQLAWRLRRSGIGPETVVGVLVDRRPELLISLLGVWKAGGAYLPMEAGHPADRLRSVLTDAGAAVLLTETKQVPRLLAPAGVEQILIDAERGALRAEPVTAPPRSGDPDGLAYLIYTSGSTGRPKGVQITHRGLANHVLWAARRLAETGTGGAPLFSSVAFDLVVPNLWAPLVTGQTVHLLPADLDLADLGAELVARGPFSFIKLTPGHLDVLARELTDEQAAGLAGTIVVAGEALPARAAEHWLRLLGPGRLINEYGPTEATVGTCILPIEEPSPTEVVAIGRPLPNMTMYVLDGDLRPLPVGVAGELYVGGTGVARGYAGRPEMTAERFLPDPFGPPGARLYKTGDVAKFRRDGAVDFLGRADDQIKIRGYRIEPGEIRAVLVAHRGVRDAVVLTLESGPAAELIAYCVPSGEELPIGDELARHCAAELPDYMVPAAFVRLDEIPLNANGKIDRRALPAPGETTEEDAFVGPSNELEEQLAAIWCRILGRERIDVRDSFFDLGGHSIRALALVGALRTAGFDIAVRDVFQHKTVASLAAALRQQTAPAQDDPAVAPFALIGDDDRAKLPAGVVDAYPLSQVQRGMVVEMLVDDNLNNYHNTMSYLVRDGGEFSLRALRAAVALAVRRHEMLRTSIALTGYSVPMQLVHGSAEMPVEELDLRDLDQREQAEVLRRFTARERATLFDLSVAPLMRITAVVLEPGVWRLVFTMIHPITEGWSFHSLLMELLGNHRLIRDGLEPEDPAPARVRYADFIAAELRSLESEEDRSYWKGVVRGYPKVTLPAGWGDDPAAPREDYQVVVLHGDLEAGLRSLATRARATLKSVLHAAHLKVLSMLTHEPEFAGGLVWNARPEVEGADKVYGMHLNSLPFPHDRSAGTWLELVRQVYTREVEIGPHRRFPMPAVQAGSGDGERLIDVLFSFNDFHMVDTELIDLTGGESDDATEFPLGVPCTPQFLILRTNSHVLSRANADRLTKMYRAVLEAMAGHPDGDARAAYLAPGEPERLRAAAGGTAGQAPVTRGLHDVFAGHARATPDAFAVRSNGTELTYAELNRRANRLAHHLIGLGAGPETLVGVCVEPGVDLVVSLLAVLKSGAAYVPLPPSHPADRLGYVCADTAAPVVISHRETAAVLDGVHGGDLVLLDAHAAAIAARPETDPVVATGPDNLAYVLYTSGSTGRPKGVAITHANVVRLFRATAGRTRLERDDVWALQHSYAFDSSVWEMWGALAHGGGLVVVPDEVAQNPDELLTVLERERVTVMALSPVAFRALTAAVGDDPRRLDRLSLRSITFGGDRLEPGDLSGWIDSQGFDRARLGQAYGPTEATVHVTYHPITPDDLDTTSGVTIGRPIDDARVYVLDPHGAQVPFGVPGELCVGGAGVARGYVNRAALTAERFVPDPYGPAGSRYYRTGDLVRMRPDGTIEFLGRTDDQVKIRGYRIEPGEIQAVLLEHPDVREAVVTGHGGDATDRRLVAYCVPAGGELPPAAELAAHCAARLPGYMVPVAFVPMTRIPLTISGKLDQRALPAPDRATRWSSRDYVAPRTATERVLAGIWSSVLGIEQVSVTDQFFALGGDSMKLLTAMSAARDAGLPISLRMLYRYGSIADLAEALDVAERTAADDGWLETVRRLRPGVEQAGGHYRIRHECDGEVQTEALSEALRAVVAQHGALRRGAAEDAEEPLREADLSTAGDREAELTERAVTEAAHRLDPSAGRLISAVLVRHGGDRPAELVIAVPELVLDRESVPVLMGDLWTAYQAVLDGRPVILPPVTAQLDGWAADLAGRAGGEAIAAEAYHWLDRAPAAALPQDRPDGPNTVAGERTVTVGLGAEPSLEVLVAALVATLGEWAGGQRVLLDLETRARSGAFDLSRAAGPYAHRFPVSLLSPPKAAPGTLLASVGAQLRAVPQEGVGYGLLRHLSGDAGLVAALTAAPAPQVRFGYAAGPVDARISRDPSAERAYLLEVDAAGAEVTWTYSAGRYDRETVRRLAERYVAAVRELDSVPRAAAAPRTTKVFPSPEETMRRNRVPGMSIVALRGGEIVASVAYGVLDTRETEPVTTDTLFRVASATKQISALGALRLASEGLIDLDEDVNAYLTAWSMPDAGHAPVTVRHLLANVAGLNRESAHRPYRPDEPVPTALDALHGRSPARTAAVRPDRAPGEQFSKNRVNYLVLEQVIADRTGMPFTEWMRQAVFTPLGMVNSGYHPDHPGTAGRPIARGHDGFGVAVAEYGPTHPATAAGGLWTTAEDLARAQLEIRRAYLGGPALISQELARQMLTPTPQTMYGLSTIVDATGADLDFGIVGEFTGYWAGAMCQVRSGDGYVLLCNGDNGREIAEFVIAATNGTVPFRQDRVAAGREVN